MKNLGLCKVCETGNIISQDKLEFVLSDCIFLDVVLNDISCDYCGCGSVLNKARLLDYRARLNAAHELYDIELEKSSSIYKFIESYQLFINSLNSFWILDEDGIINYDADHDEFYIIEECSYTDEYYELMSLEMSAGTFDESFDPGSEYNCKYSISHFEAWNYILFESVVKPKLIEKLEEYFGGYLELTGVYDDMWNFSVVYDGDFMSVRDIKTIGIAKILSDITDWT